MSSSRVASIDRLRGAAMVLMALDHTRDFFQPAGSNPEDLDTTTLLFFSMRWVTHFCAPVFVLLAGTSAHLVHRRHGDAARTASFLARRGLWLMLLEAAVISPSWFFGYSRVHLGVVWGIGGAMVLLAAAVRLGMARWLGWLGAAGTVALAIWPVPAGTWLGLLFQPGWWEPAWFPVPIQSVYVFGPWFFVMAMGWGLTKLLADPGRARQVAQVGGMMLLAFVAMRTLGFGDPRAFELQDTASKTLMDFFRASKYPPSLAYLTMTLGPALLLVPALGRRNSPLLRAVEVFGQVPLFYYLLHLPVIHLGGLLYARRLYGEAPVPAEVPLSVTAIACAWLGFVLLLWPVCAAYRDVKRSGRFPLLRWL